MIYRNDNGTAYFQFEHLAAFAEIGHAIFTRSPGCSARPFDGLNVSFAVGDDPARVGRNRQLVAECLRADELIFAHQVHGDTVLVLDGRPTVSAAAPADEPLTGDALATGLPGNFLAVTVADCQAILIYDPRRRVVANVHSGWRGSIANLAGRTLAVMRARYGCAPEDVRAGIGPSLGPCCAEFVNYRREIPRELWQYRCGSSHFDFWSMTRDQLVTAGMRPQHIQQSGLCTKCRTDLFFSYRAEKTTGRFPAVIGLRQERPKAEG